jgi:hypothetical protein
MFEVLRATALDVEAIAAAAAAAKLSLGHCAGIAKEELGVAEAVGGGPRYEAMREFFNAVANLKGGRDRAAQRPDIMS